MKIPAEVYNREYFLTDCGGYREFLETNGLKLGEIMSNALSIAKVRDGMTVLDVGCGRGEIVLHASLKKAKSFGIDYSKDAVELAMGLISKYPEVKDYVSVMKGNSTDIPFDSESFDRIFLLDVIEHLNDAELNKTLSEVYHVLKNNGYVVIHTSPNRWYYNYGYLVYRMLVYAIRRVKLKNDIRTEYEKKLHINEQSILSLQKKLRKTGFLYTVWLDGGVDDNNILKYNLPGGWVDSISQLLNIPPLFYIFRKEIYAIAWKNKDLSFPGVLLLDNSPTDVITIGENDYGLLWGGWYKIEDWPPKIRWTKKKANAYLKIKKENQKVCLLAFIRHPDVKEKNVIVSISINNKLSNSIYVKEGGWVTLASKEVKLTPNAIINITIAIDRTWIPSSYGINQDTRELGLAIHKIWLD